EFGNRIKIIELDNQNFTQHITYDQKVHSYPIGYTDSYGYDSEVSYNFLFGTPVLVTDINHNKLRTRIDNRGRIIEITGPKMLHFGGGLDWTIRYRYQGENPVSQQVQNLSTQEYMTTQSQGGFIASYTNSNTSNHQHYAVTRHTKGA